MTEPTDRPAAAPYDEAMAALAHHAGVLPSLVVLDRSVLLTPAGAPSTAARAVAAACHAKGLRVIGAASSEEEAQQLEQLLMGCEARVLVGGRVLRAWRGWQLRVGGTLDSALVAGCVVRRVCCSQGVLFAKSRA